METYEKENKLRKTYEEFNNISIRPRSDDVANTSEMEQKSSNETPPRKAEANGQPSSLGSPPRLFPHRPTYLYEEKNEGKNTVREWVTQNSNFKKPFNRFCNESVNSNVNKNQSRGFSASKSNFSTETSMGKPRNLQRFGDSDGSSSTEDCCKVEQKIPENSDDVYPKSSVKEDSSSASDLSPDYSAKFEIVAEINPLYKSRSESTSSIASEAYSPNVKQSSEFLKPLGRGRGRGFSKNGNLGSVLNNSVITNSAPIFPAFSAKSQPVNDVVDKTVTSPLSRSNALDVPDCSDDWQETVTPRSSGNRGNFETKQNTRFGNPEFNNDHGKQNNNRVLGTGVKHQFKKDQNNSEFSICNICKQEIHGKFRMSRNGSSICADCDYFNDEPRNHYANGDYKHSSHGNVSRFSKGFRNGQSAYDRNEDRLSSNGFRVKNDYEAQDDQFKNKTKHNSDYRLFHTNNKTTPVVSSEPEDWDAQVAPRTENKKTNEETVNTSGEILKEVTKSGFPAKEVFLDPFIRLNIMKRSFNNNVSAASFQESENSVSSSSRESEVTNENSAKSQSPRSYETSSDTSHSPSAQRFTMSSPRAPFRKETSSFETPEKETSTQVEGQKAESFLPAGCESPELLKIVQGDWAEFIEKNSPSRIRHSEVEIINSSCKSNQQNEEPKCYSPSRVENDDYAIVRSASKDTLRGALQFGLVTGDSNRCEMACQTSPGVVISPVLPKYSSARVQTLANETPSVSSLEKLPISSAIPKSNFIPSGAFSLPATPRHVRVPPGFNEKEIFPESSQTKIDQSASKKASHASPSVSREKEWTSQASSDTPEQLFAKFCESSAATGTFSKEEMFKLFSEWYNKETQNKTDKINCDKPQHDQPPVSKKKTSAIQNPEMEIQNATPANQTVTSEDYVPHAVPIPPPGIVINPAIYPYSINPQFYMDPRMTISPIALGSPLYGYSFGYGPSPVIPSSGMEYFQTMPGCENMQTGVEYMGAAPEYCQGRVCVTENAPNTDDGRQTLQRDNCRNSDCDNTQAVSMQASGSVSTLAEQGNGFAAQSTSRTSTGYSQQAADTLPSQSGNY